MKFCEFEVQRTLIFVEHGDVMNQRCSAPRYCFVLRKGMLQWVSRFPNRGIIIRSRFGNCEIRVSFFSNPSPFGHFPLSKGKNVRVREFAERGGDTIVFLSLLLFRHKFSDFSDVPYQGDERSGGVRKQNRLNFIDEVQPRYSLLRFIELLRENIIFPNFYSSFVEANLFIA